MSNKSIFDFWAFGKTSPPRPGQVTALEWLEKQTAKYIILEAPVGIGKSAIGITYSRYLAATRGARSQKGSYVLTPQRILQAQYEDSFKSHKDIGLASLYGKGNYTCASKNASCEIGSVIKPRCHSCPHSIARDRARSAPNTVLNYKLALTSFAYTDTFKERQLLIADECHTLEEHLVDFDAVTIAEWRCKKYRLKWGVKTTMQGAVDYLKDSYLSQITNAVATLDAECEPLLDMDARDLTKRDVKKLRELNEMISHRDNVYEISVTPFEELSKQYVLTYDKTMMQFKRLTGAHSFRNILKPFGETFLFMSSTVLNKDGYCNDLGIDPKEAVSMSLDSEFEPEKRPVYYMPIMKMNAKWKDDDNVGNRKRMMDKVAEIANMHDDQSGIIHTGNFAIAKWLCDGLKNRIPQVIYDHNPDSELDRNSVIQEFQSSPRAAILISPSSTEGLDLVDDAARFAIVAKVPFGFLGDQWIKRRLSMSQEWYQRQALIEIIQGGGRIVRSSDDWGNVYILDQSWGYLMKMTDRMIPQWWKDAYRVM